MKFNVEIDLDWVGEGETVSDTVQKEIIANIENRLSKKIMDSVAKATEDKINSVLTAQVGQAVSAKITELLEKPRTVTDRYGNVTKENWTLESMLIEEIEKAFDGKVFDKDGQRNTYNAQYSLIEIMIKKNLEPLVNERTKKITEETKAHIEQLVKDKIKTQVADKLTSLIVENSSSLDLKTGSA